MIVGGVGLVAALAAAFTLSSHPARPDETGEVLPLAPSPVEEPPFPTELVSDSGLGMHPVYRHSIVAGGVHSLADVESAVAVDPVVQRHYSNVSVANLQVVRTPARREAYMSYRIGDQVYWTSKKVALAEGEAVLTDGATTIRARCGNLVSDEAMSPTSADEPPASAFDEVVPPPAGDASASSGVAGVGGEAPGAPQALIAGPGGSSGPAPGGAPANNQSFGGGGVGPFGGSGGLVVPPGGQTSSNSGGLSPDLNPPGGGPGDIPPAGPDFPGPGNPPGFPPPGFPPGFDNPPGFDDPDGPDWPDGPDGPDGPNGPEPPVIIIEPPPPVVTPVPEPGSLLLLGSGLALAAWRARRRQSRRKDS